MKNFYYNQSMKVLIFLLVIVIAESSVKIQKYELQNLPSWTPDRVIYGKSSEISCLSICERDDQNCNVVEFVQSSLECKIGWIDSVDIGPGEGYGFYRIPNILIDVIVRVVDSLDNSPLTDVNIGVQRSNGEQLPSHVTDSDGTATFQITNGGALTITGEKSGFTMETTNRILTNSPLQEIVLSMSPSLQPDEFRSVLTWACCVQDLDMFTYSSQDLSCWVDFNEVTCSRGTSGLVSFLTDSGDFGSEGGETIDWVGDFPSPDPYIIWVRNYHWETEISKAGAIVTMFSGNEPSIKVVAPSEPLTNTSFWLVGCFDPNIGLASFQEINVYTNDDEDFSLCLIS